MADYTRMESCYRCGERKEAEKFRPEQPYWARFCMRCEAPPAGKFPIPETPEHRWKP